MKTAVTQTMITFIPYQKFEIKTRLGQEAARQKLQEIVEPRKLRWGLSRNQMPFEGQIEGNAFKISNIIRYRNSFNPVLDGKIRDDLDVSTLQITARPIWFVAFLWTFLLVGTGAGGVLSGDLLEEFWLILPFLLFFYGIPIAAFNLELNKAKKILEKQFQADPFPLVENQ